MKKISLIAMCLMVAIQSWALTQTGMPALDELRNDAENNGPLSKKLDFSENQRDKIKDYIDRKSDDLVKKRDELVAAEKKVERKDAKKIDKDLDTKAEKREARAEKREAKAEAREEKGEAHRDLTQAREEIFAGLKGLMNDDQYDALKKWRAEGKANTR